MPRPRLRRFQHHGFQPDRAPGLFLWLKADSITGLNDGDAVVTWADSSGQGNDVTNATSAERPTYKTNILNGLPVVRTPVNKRLGTLSLLSGNNYTVLIVYRSSDNTSDALNYIIGTAGTTSGTGRGIIYGGNLASYNGFSVYGGGGTGSVQSTHTVDLNVHLLAIRRHGAWLDFFVDGAPAGSFDETTNGNSRLIFSEVEILGRADTDWSGLSAVGDMGEVAIYKTSVYDAVLTDWHRYAKAKWGTP